MSNVYGISKEIQSKESDLLCLLVFSDRKHVDYIYPVLTQIEETLHKKHFKPQRLGEEIRSGEDYFIKLEELINDCVLGIVILDGLRPNVLFEFGFLKGKQKNVIILQSNGATVNIKTLYTNNNDSELSPKAFQRLKAPRLSIGNHLSDYAGKHVSYFDWGAASNENSNVSKILVKELEKRESDLVKEIRKVKTKGINPTFLETILNPLNKIITYHNLSTIYHDVKKVNINELREAHNKIIDLSKQSTSKVPYDIHNMIAEIYMVISKDAEQRNNIIEIVEYIELAKSIYNNILKEISEESNPVEYGDVQKKLGDIYYQIGQYKDKIQNMKFAIDAYENALKIYTINDFTKEYASTQNNLGNAYQELSEYIDRESNLNNAIKAYDESLKALRIINIDA